MSSIPEPASAPTRAFDARELRTAFGSFATGVTIVTCRGNDGVDYGLTANSFSSVSLNPPLILWSLASSSSSIGVFRSADHFAVHVLAADQEPLSARFATKGIDRFAALDIERGSGGAPLLEGCSARFVCRTAFQYEGGDHTIFVGAVEGFAYSDRIPLVFHGGRYGFLLRQEPEPPAACDQTLIGPSPDDLIYGLARAYHLMRRDAAVERQRHGWSESQYVAMSVLGWQDGCRLEDIDAFAKTRGLSISPVVLAPLAADGLIRMTEPLTMRSEVRLTPAGREVMITLAAILKAGEAAAVDRLDAGELRLLKQLLRGLGPDTSLAHTKPRRGRGGEE